MTSEVPRIPTLGEQNRSAAHDIGVKEKRIGLGLFLLATFTSALYAFVIYRHQGIVVARIDLNGFGLLARHIALGDGFGFGDGPTLRRAPLYPAFAALLLRVFGHYGWSVPDSVAYRPILAAQCLMVGCTAVTAWTLGRKLFGCRTGIIAGVLCAFTPQVIRYVGMTEVETTMGLLIALMALTGLNLLREPTAANGALFGLVNAAATLVKPVAMLYPLVFLGLWGLRGLRPRAEADNDGEDTRDRSQRPRRRRIRFDAAVAVLGTYIACLAPWSLRNIVITHGRFMSISSNAPGEFLRGYVNAQPKFAFLHQDFGGSDTTHMDWDMEANLYEDAILRKHGAEFVSNDLRGTNGEPVDAGIRIRLELRKEQVESAEAKRRVFHEPGGVLRKFLIQLLTFWYIVETRKKSVMVGLIAAPTLALALYGWSAARKERIDTMPLVSVVLYFYLLYAAILAFARYSMPVFPTLLVLTSYGITRLPWISGHANRESAPQSGGQIPGSAGRSHTKMRSFCAWKQTYEQRIRRSSPKRFRTMRPL